MKEEYKKLPYRNNVSLVTFKGDKFLLINNVDWKEGWWKFPQGGVKDGEDLTKAGTREFEEELGTSKFKVVGLSKYTNSYDWEDWMIEDKNCTFRGQFQKYLVIEFLGDDTDIVLPEDELSGYKWITKEDLLKYSEDEEHRYFKNYNGLMPMILEEFAENISG